MPLSLTRLKKAAALAVTIAPLTFAALAAPTATAQSAQSSDFADHLGRPTPMVMQQLDTFTHQPWVPPEISQALRTAVDFYAGRGALGGPALPENGPAINQFIWPTVALNCIGPTQHSTGSAIAVPGPADIPLPGVPAGHAGFVFTALGTPGAAKKQGRMHAYWLNLSNGRAGVTPLDNKGINPTGPATLSGVANTGPGHVIAVIGGNVRTTAKVCSFAPTAASFNVR